MTDDITGVDAGKDGSVAGYIGYGTKPLLRRFCVPMLDKLPKEIDNE